MFALLCSLPLLSARSTDNSVHIRVIPLEGSERASSSFGADDFLRILPLDGPSSLVPSSNSLSGTGDAMLDSILRDLDRTPLFSDFIPHARHHFRHRFGKNHPCHGDAQRLCHGSYVDRRHPLHCLGKQASLVSASCVKSIERSIPFTCSSQITLFCPPEKLLERNILSCLEDQVDKKVIHSSECKDAIKTTRGLIDNLKTGSSLQLVDPVSGHPISIGIMKGLYDLLPRIFNYSK